MTKRFLTAALTTLSLAALASSAMAQDTRRGDGDRNRNRDAAARSAAASKPSTFTPAPDRPIVGRDTKQAGGHSTGGGWWGGNAHTPGIDRSQAEQNARITWGQRNGSITQAEARALRAEQDRIADLERRAKADGRVTHEERQVIRSTQRDADRHIWQESHDRDGRNSNGHRRNGWFGWW